MSTVLFSVNLLMKQVKLTLCLPSLSVTVDQTVALPEALVSLGDQLTESGTIWEPTTQDKLLIRIIKKGLRIPLTSSVTLLAQPPWQ